jgi:hypothetical protein
MRGLAKTEVVAAAALPVALLLLALWSTLALRAPEDTLCAQDRVELKPAYRVVLEMRSGRRFSVCNVTCALLFLRETGKPLRSVTVLDEATGEPLDSESAFYVESRVFTHRESANRIHVFAGRADAEEHAGSYEGEILPSPFTEHLP